MSCGCQNTEIEDFCPDAPDETVDALAEVTTSQPLHRRTLLKAAAIGGAVAAMANRGGTSPFSAMAHTDTKSACTAQDIEVSGGTIINEPCAEGGNFNAIAQFTVSNHNNAARKCITLHLGAGTLFGGNDYLLTDSGGSSNISGNGTTKTMFANLGSVPANFAGACFDGSVIAFQTQQNQSDTACSGPLTKYPGGQCRRQQICIVGFGVTLACASAGCASTGAANCTVPCGGTLYLKAVASGSSQGAQPTYTFTLYRGGVLVPATDYTLSGGCFTVPNPQAGSYTVVVADSLGCTRTSNAVSVTVSSITASMTPVASTGCGDAGQITFNASTSPAGTCTFRWFVDSEGGGTPDGTGSSFTYNPAAFTGHLNGSTHFVKVIADCGGCAASAKTNVSACVTTTTTAV